MTLNANLSSLPIDPFLSDIVSAVTSSPSVILTASPGAGKTTRLPPELLHAVNGRILVLQPRRMAVVSATHRIARERCWKIGEAVGYQVRFESRVSRQTRLIFMTDALALRRLAGDPELRDVDLVVIDEFHERNLNQDIMLGCLRELQELGRNIKLLVMSATLQTERLERFLPGAKVFDIPGQVFPLDIHYSNETLSLRTDRDFYDRMERATILAADKTEGDVLVFLPGTGEIRKTKERLMDHNLTDREVQELHGSLSLKEQQVVLAPSARQRIILSTNIAEASVTVDGVDAVVDCGLAKVMDANYKTGFSQLDLSRISKFNAQQRAGRAARQKPGVCWRLWTPHEEVTQMMEPIPECRRVDLSQSLLLLAHLGISRFSEFAWFDEPSETLLQMAISALRSWNALDRENRLTDLGRRLIDFPLPPRWGTLLAFGEDHDAGELAARICAILSNGDRGGARNGPTTRFECDVRLRLEMLEESPRGPIQDAAHQLARSVKSGSAQDDDGRIVRKLLLHTQRDRLCRRRGSGSDRALMAGGRGVRLSPESQVRDSEFFLALAGVDRPGQPDTTITMACGLTKDFVLSELGHQLLVRDDVFFDENREQFYSRRGRFLGDLPIDEPTLQPAEPSIVAEQFTALFLERWEAMISRHPKLKSWMERWSFARQFDSKFELSTTVRKQFAETATFGKRSLAEVLESDLIGLLESLLDRELLREFKSSAPREFTAPSGLRHPIDYSEGHAAYVEVRLQELFGLTQHPHILKGRVPLAFRLLGPNFRPVQVTSDIPGFWTGAYHDVRKELRARYPKHSWPEDPRTAKPEAKGSRRR